MNLQQIVKVSYFARHKILSALSAITLYKRYDFLEIIFKLTFKDKTILKNNFTTKCFEGIRNILLTKKNINYE